MKRTTFADFEQFLLIKRGLQPITIQGYVGAIARISKVIGQFPSQETLENYIYQLYSSNYSYSHKINTVLAIERYTEFLGTPCNFGRQKKPKTIIKDTLTEAEITKLIFNCKNSREKAIISLLAYSGIRNRELCFVKVKDFDIGRNTIRIIKGKGLRDGISQVASECSKMLLNYLKEYPRKEEDFLFTTLQKNNQYSGWDLRKLVKMIARRAKINKRVYPHLLRHSLAVNLLARGANVVLIQQQLRHSLLETTLQYINSIVFGFKNEYEKYVPSYI